MRLSFTLALTSALVATGCDQVSTPTQLEPQLARSGHQWEKADVFWFGDPPTPAHGMSAIRRTVHGVNVGLRSKGLEASHVYTAWLVIFNTPEGCVEGCGDDDLFNPGATVDVVYLAGRVAGRTGNVSLRGHRSVGDASGSLFAQLGAPSPGLLDAGAEVHVVVRDHGPRVRGSVRDQLRTFEGGCTPETSHGLGDGPNACADVQFAVHLL